MVTNISKAGIDLCAYYECAGDPTNPKWLNAYLDSGGVWTIGIGTIKYPNGQRVKKGDTITPEQRDEYFLFEIKDKVERVNFLTRDDIGQEEFDAVTDFSYNVGTVGLQKSTLLKTVNESPADIPAIVKNFLAWRFDNGKEVAGLTRRRMSEAYMFFTGKLKTDWANYKKYSAATVNEVVKAVQAA